MIDVVSLDTAYRLDIEGLTPTYGTGRFYYAGERLYYSENGNVYDLQKDSENEKGLCLLLPAPTTSDIMKYLFSVGRPISISLGLGDAFCAYSLGGNKLVGTGENAAEAAADAMINILVAGY